MNKKIVFLIGLMILGTALVGAVLISPNDIKRDVPSPLDPEFVKKIKNCGKLDLIDRASSKYNPSALIDGSLKECGN